MYASFPFVADRADVHAAADLLLSHGLSAHGEATARADRARDLGNHLHFCRWRQVARLVAWFADDAPGGTLH